MGSSHTSILFLGQQKDLTSRGLADVPLGSMAAHNSRMARNRDAIPGCADAHAGVSHTYEGRSTVDLAGLARSHIFAGGGVKHAPARTNVNLSLSGSPCKELPLLLTGSSIVMAAHGWHMGFLRQTGFIQRRWIAHRSQLALIYDWRIQRSSELIPGKGADRQNLPPASLRRPPAPSPSEGDRTKREDMRSQKFPNRHGESLPKVQASKRCPLKGWEGTGQKTTSDISKGRSEPCRDVCSECPYGLWRVGFQTPLVARNLSWKIFLSQGAGRTQKCALCPLHGLAPDRDCASRKQTEYWH